MASTLLHDSQRKRSKGIDEILGYYQTYHNYSLEKPQPPDFYDAEYGLKKTLAKSVQDSDNRMSIMRSGVQRFKPKRASDITPFGHYNTDIGSRASMETFLKQNKRFYSATFGNAPRLADGLITDAPDIMYDTKRLKNSGYYNMVDEMKESPIKYSIISSKYNRLAKPQKTDAPDIIYDVDYGPKYTLYTNMQNSPIQYSNILKSKTMRGKGTTYQTSCPEKVGPGSYDFSYVKDLKATKVDEEKRPISCFASGTSRFYNDRIDPSKNLGSTWRQKHDDVSWAKNYFTIPKCKYLRPQYLPQSLAEE